MDALDDGDQDDPVAVAVPKIVTPNTVVQLTLTQFWSILGALAIVGGGLGTYVHQNTAGLVVRMGILEARVDAIEKKVDRLIAWIENRDNFPGSKTITQNDAQSVPAPPTTPPPTPSPDAAPDAPRSFPLKTIPSDVKPYAPPVCVEKTTHRAIACHDARECYPRGAFTPEHFAKVMAEAGVDSPSAQICAARE